MLNRKLAIFALLFFVFLLRDRCFAQTANLIALQKEYKEQIELTKILSVAMFEYDGATWKQLQMTEDQRQKMIKLSQKHQKILRWLTQPLWDYDKESKESGGFDCQKYNKILRSKVLQKLTLQTEAFYNDANDVLLTKQVQQFEHLLIRLAVKNVSPDQTSPLLWPAVMAPELGLTNEERKELASQTKAEIRKLDSEFKKNKPKLKQIDEKTKRTFESFFNKEQLKTVYGKFPPTGPWRPTSPKREPELFRIEKFLRYPQKLPSAPSPEALPPVVYRELWTRSVGEKEFQKLLEKHELEKERYAHMRIDHLLRELVDPNYSKILFSSVHKRLDLSEKQISEFEKLIKWKKEQSQSFEYSEIPPEDFAEIYSRKKSELDRNCRSKANELLLDFQKEELKMMDSRDIAMTVGRPLHYWQILFAHDCGLTKAKQLDLLSTINEIVPKHHEEKVSLQRSIDEAKVDSLRKNSRIGSSEASQKCRGHRD